MLWLDQPLELHNAQLYLTLVVCWLDQPPELQCVHLCVAPMCQLDQPWELQPVQLCGTGVLACKLPNFM